MFSLRILALAALTGWGSTALAQVDDSTSSAPAPKFAVVVHKGRGAPNLKRPVKKYIEKKLKVFGDQVTFNQYRKAARQAGIRKKTELPEVATARTVGPALGLSHVIIVESVREREQVGKRKKNVFYAELAVVDVNSGDVLLTNRYKLAGRRLTLSFLARGSSQLGVTSRVRRLGFGEVTTESEETHTIATDWTAVTVSFDMVQVADEQEDVDAGLVYVEFELGCNSTRTT